MTGTLHIRAPARLCEASLTRFAEPSSEPGKDDSTELRGARRIVFVHHHGDCQLARHRADSLNLVAERAAIDIAQFDPPPAAVIQQAIGRKGTQCVPYLASAAARCIGPKQTSAQCVMARLHPDASGASKNGRQGTRTQTGLSALQQNGCSIFAGALRRLGRSSSSLARAFSTSMTNMSAMSREKFSFTTTRMTAMDSAAWGSE